MADNIIALQDSVDIGQSCYSQDPALIAWFNALDSLDPYYGDPGALSDLVVTAPTPELADWLTIQIHYNRLFREAHFTMH